MNKAAFESRVMEILRENAASKWRRHREDGHLDPRSLHEFRVSPEIWRLKEVAGAKKYCAAFVLDMSGSMDGPKAVAAESMALQFADSMSVLGIPFCIYAFGTGPVRIFKVGEYYSRPKLKARLRAVYRFPSSFFSDSKNGFDLSWKYEPNKRDSHYETAQEARVKQAKSAFADMGGSTFPAAALGLAISEVSETGAEPIIIFMSDGEIGINNSFEYSSLCDCSLRLKRLDKELQSAFPEFLEHLKRRGFERYNGKNRHDNSKTYRLDRKEFGIVGWAEKRWRNPGDEVVSYDIVDLSASAMHWYVKEKLGGQFLFMGIQDESLMKFASSGMVPADDCFTVHHLAQGYDAIVSKLSKNFNFDHAKRLR